MWCTKHMSCMNSCCKRWGQRLACSNNRCYLEAFLVSRHMYSNYCLYALCCCGFRSHDSHRDTFLLWESERLCYEMIHPFSFSFRRVLQLRLASWARRNNVLKSPVKQQCVCVRERVCGCVCLCVCVRGGADLLREMHPYSHRATVRLSSPSQW